MNLVLKKDQSSHFKLIFEGINRANGKLEEDFQYLTAEELSEIGRKAAERGNFKRSLKSYIIEPINDIAESVAKYGIHIFTDSSIIAEEKIPSKKIKLQKKKIYIVPSNWTNITAIELDKYLNFIGLKPCENAPNYLLGYQAYYVNLETGVSQTHKIVAVDLKNASSLFTLTAQQEEFYFLALRTKETKDSLANKQGKNTFIDLVNSKTTFCFGANSWAFIAEDICPM